MQMRLFILTWPSLKWDAGAMWLPTHTHTHHLSTAKGGIHTRATVFFRVPAELWVGWVNGDGGLRDDVLPSRASGHKQPTGYSGRPMKGVVSGANIDLTGPECRPSGGNGVPTLTPCAAHRRGIAQESLFFFRREQGRGEASSWQVPFPRTLRCRRGQTAHALDILGRVHGEPVGDPVTQTGQGGVAHALSAHLAPALIGEGPGPALGLGPFAHNGPGPARRPPPPGGWHTHSRRT